MHHFWAMPVLNFLGMKKWVIAGCICAFLVTACDKDEDENELNQTDRTFVSMASISNNAEVMAGQLAATKATNTAVKAFGQQMVTEHTAAQQDLKGRASGVGLNAPDTVDAEHQALMARLDTLSGNAFDTVYMNSQVRDHARTIDLFTTEINNGRHSTIRSYASDYLPHIQQHLVKADSIRKLL